ncbi:MAG: hypothetical protein AAF517_08655 [Planctomycetota bacterium]
MHNRGALKVPGFPLGFVPGVVAISAFVVSGSFATALGISCIATALFGADLEVGDSVTVLVPILFFVGFGAILLRAALRHLFHYSRWRSNKAAYPSEPWRWRDDWSAKSGSPTLPLLAASSCFVAVALLGKPFFENVSLYGRSASPLSFLVLFLSGCVISSCVHTARRAIVRSKRCGSAWLELDDGAGTIGGVLRGRVRFARPSAIAEPVTLLLCGSVEGVRRGELGFLGIFSTPTDSRQVRVRAKDAVVSKDDGTAIPFSVTVPEFFPPSDVPSLTEFVDWRLTVRVGSESSAFRWVFPVPIFSSEQLEEWGASAATPAHA